MPNVLFIIEYLYAQCIFHEQDKKWILYAKRVFCSGSADSGPYPVAITPVSQFTIGFITKPLTRFISCLKRNRHLNHQLPFSIYLASHQTSTRAYLCHRCRCCKPRTPLPAGSQVQRPLLAHLGTRSSAGASSPRTSPYLVLMLNRQRNFDESSRKCCDL